MKQTNKFPYEIYFISIGAIIIVLVVGVFLTNILSKDIEEYNAPECKKLCINNDYVYYKVSSGAFGNTACYCYDKYNNLKDTFALG